MSWSFRLGRFFGIDVFVHITFVLLLGFIGLSHWKATEDVGAALAGVGFFAALFACVLLHEFGHALTARKFGVKTRDITLLPIGGLARLERIPEKPIQEFWVALAGPAVNVVIAGLLFAYLRATDTPVSVETLSVTSGSLVARLAVVNIFLVVFNMLPAFPMDGGRVLRAVLAMRLEYTRATEIAARLGQSIAFGLGFLGLFWSPFLVFIAFFVWIGAAAESGMVQMKSALTGMPMKRVMITDFRSLSPSDPLSRAVDYVIGGFQQDFPVVDEEGELVGMLDRADLIADLAKHGPERRVGDVMNREFQTADAHEMADGVLARLQECRCQSLPVVHNGRLVGILTSENLGEFVMIQGALRGKTVQEARV